MLKSISKILLGLAWMLMIASCQSEQGNLSVIKTTADHSATPLGVIGPPNLSWIMEAGTRACYQKAYQVMVASSPTLLAEDTPDIWDSGKVDSNQSHLVAYRGKALESAAKYFWKVRVWDQEDGVSAWSEPDYWVTGLIDPTDWQAEWVGLTDTSHVQPAPFYRKNFLIEKPVKEAFAYIAGLGYHEFYLNNEKVGDHMLDPAFTRYDRRVLYTTYDVGEHLVQGTNAMGAVLGNGWYNMHTKAVWYFDAAPWRAKPCLRLQLHITYEDGEKVVFGSDETWQKKDGPILFDGVRNGEVYDAGKELGAWSAPDFEAQGWEKARKVEGPAGKLWPQLLPPIKVMRDIQPEKIYKINDTTRVVDFGQNFSGWVTIRPAGAAGTRVTLRYSERINEDGSIDRVEISKFVQEGDFQTDIYVLKGEGKETWSPRFTYHGFRYVEVTGWPGELQPEDITGKLVHTSFDETGHFSCANEQFNKIQQNTLWAYVSNFHGYPTDCPQREKNGWTGDAHLAAEQGLYNFEPTSAYVKWLNDLQDEQKPGGELPGIVPTSGWGYDWGNGPAWDSAYPLISWYLYLYRGDTAILRNHYENITRYVDYLKRKSEGYIVDIGLGDWVPADTETPRNVTSTAYFFVDAQIASRMAAILGKEKESHQYAELANEIRAAFNEKFYRPETATYANGSQTALSCALYQGLATPETREAVLAALIEEIAERDWHLDVGILGAKYLLNALSEMGKTDIAYRIVNQKTYPGWGYWIEQGATTLWEDWKGKTSRNHIMFGDVSAWFYKYLAGIRPMASQPGFKEFTVAPHFLDELDWVKSQVGTPYGSIVCNWQKDEGQIDIELKVPVNTTATLEVPTRFGANITESGRPVQKVEDIVTEFTGNTVSITLKGGQYTLKISKT